MSDELMAGLISAVVALLVALLTTGVTIWATRKQLKETADAARRERASSSLVTALGYFTGGSQNRSVEISAIRGLEGKKDLGEQFRNTVVPLFRGQLLYLLAHGSNRWESHEVGNIREMMTIYLELAPGCASSKDMREVGNALQRYRDEWEQRNVPKVPGGNANEDMVERLLEDVDGWRKELDKSNGDGRPSTKSGRS